MRAIDADALKADYGMKDDCEDCEKELKGYVKRCQYDAVYTKMDFCGWIDAMPTIEPESNWISCKERLPDESNFYMVTNEYDEVEIIWFAHKDDYDIDKSEWRETDDKILAWMPLPESFKEEGGEE